MTTSPRVPELCAGDVLVRDEFERRYAAMPDLKKAELIERVVYMPSPVRYQQHGNPHLLLGYWLVTYAEGTPGLSCATDATDDLHQKWNVYRRAGMREYVVLRTEDAAIDWFVQRGGAFERIVPGADGVLRSEVFPGLWLDVAAVLRLDSAAVRAGVLRGMQTLEHAAFCAEHAR